MAFRQKPQICQHGPPTTVDFLVKPLEKAKAGKAITTKLSYASRIMGPWILCVFWIQEKRPQYAKIALIARLLQIVAFSKL